MEDRANQARGHKATLSNPNVSDETKQHSRDVLENEFGEQTQTKGDPRVVGGLKSAINNPQVSEEAKRSAEERLRQME